MCSLMVFFKLASFGIVDRIEGPMAVIEWNLTQFSDVPVWLLPGVQEGDRICMVHPP